MIGAAKAMLRLTLPKGDDTSLDDGPLTPRRVLRVESKVEAASSWTLECHGCGQWNFMGRPDEVRASDTLEAVRHYLDDGNEGTRNEIAKELGISRSYVSRIEKRALMKLYHEFYKAKR